MEAAMTSQTQAIKNTPWHLLAVGLTTLVWNAFGLMRFVTVQAGVVDPAALGLLELAVFASLPVWAAAFWGLWFAGGVAGAVLLLAKSKWARPAFGAALVGMMGSVAGVYSVTGTAWFLNAMPIAFSAALITLTALLYAISIRKHDILS
jgi:hypothetical protein